MGDGGVPDASGIRDAEGVPPRRPDDAARNATCDASRETSRDDSHAARCASRNQRRRAAIVLVALGVLVVASTLASLMLGRFPITPAEAGGMLANLVAPVEPFWTAQQETLFFQVRLPRIALALLVGCSLAAAGAAFQGTFQNPLVSPDILGASQGAAFGAAVAILLGLGAFGISAFAFAAAIVTVLLVLLVSSRAKGNHMMVVVLAGVMMSSLLQAAVSYTKLIADPTDQLAAITYWLMGSLTGAKPADLAMAAAPMAAGLLILFALRWRINILTMGDDEASTMGVNAQRVRIVVIFAATLVTAASVAVTGMIGWVGLVIPHFARMVIGCDYRKLLPASMLMGASFLLIVDDVARLATTSEIPIGILTAFIGAPFFLYLITRKKQL
ncbi:FecCD family ABC transporter permease [Gordonibacter urolithinfaciens]|uniref:FecCD family ABC transporter permease n=2 Tax=Gordonibacter urolithinfaciens TaxID=1335613 RepID=UPI001DA025DA|nr:iron ABC transporter permease [Gordonibacter urolithinfaciens]HJF63382.1 iron ABC transporter permease [Gordonibacter urolithinfaciens]